MQAYISIMYEQLCSPRKLYLLKLVSSQFDRRLFRSRVHSIETKGQIEAKVSIEEQMKKTETQCICRLFFVLLSTAKLNIFKQI